MPFQHGPELKKAFAAAKKGGYALLANNVAEPNILIGLLDGAKQSRADLLVQMSLGSAKFAGGGNALAGLRALAAYIKEAATAYDVGVFLNLDHQTYDNLELIRTAIRERIPSSIMIDASHETFARNVAISREVADLAHAEGILVEGEMGKIKGAEDEIVSDEAFYTRPDEAVEFVAKTGVDLLAISIGTQHGVSAGKKLALRLDLAAQIDAALRKAGHDIPLVMHGSSGLSRAQLRDAVKTGVCKINRDTLYQYLYARQACRFYGEHKSGIEPPPGAEIDLETFEFADGWSPDKDAFDPRVVGKKIRAEIRDRLAAFNQEVGAAGKSLYS